MSERQACEVVRMENDSHASQHGGGPRGNPGTHSVRALRLHCVQQGRGGAARKLGAPQLVTWQSSGLNLGPGPRALLDPSAALSRSTREHISIWVFVYFSERRVCK